MLIIIEQIILFLEELCLLIHHLLMFRFIVLELIVKIFHGIVVVSVKSHGRRVGLEEFVFGIVVESVSHIEVILIYLLT